MPGKIENVVACKVQVGYSQVPIHIQPYKATFVVFRQEAGESRSIEKYDSDYNHPWDEMRSETDLRVNLPNWAITSIRTPLSYATVPDDLTLFGIGNWNAYQELAAFAGTAQYETAFKHDNEWSSLEEDLRCTLDLGEVGEIAVVHINEMTLAPAICPPYRWEFPFDWIRSGGRIRVEVTNMLGSYFRDDECRRKTPSPSGLIGPVTVKNEPYVCANWKYLRKSKLMRFVWMIENGAAHMRYSVFCCVQAEHHEMSRVILYENFGEIWYCSRLL